MEGRSVITVYTKPGCLPCKRVLAKLLDAGLEYRVIDISEDPRAYDYVTKQLGAKSVPVVDAGEGTIILGYQPEQLKTLIQAAKYFRGDLTLNEGEA